MKNAPTLLLIEDDRSISQNLSDFLSQEGFQIQVVYTGNDALSVLASGRFDLLILDVNLPDLDGFQICQAFRKYNSETPILMLTAYDELEDKMKGFEMGADDYLTKPFFMVEVLARIKSLLKRANKQPGQTSLIWVEDLSIDVSTNAVSRAKQEINLTPREFNLLLMLVKAKGKIVTKKELNKQIWGGSLDEHNNTIEVYINFLRKKIDKPFSTQLIKTKIGFGYYLDVL
ncbi:MAG: response regulator transcription factor [Aquirufa sp.]|jgi:DNA-binding response OmpR family regulator